MAFVLLQVFSLYMLFKYNRVHRAVFLGVANEFTGSMNMQVDKLDDYFHQGEENRRLHRMNDSLLNLLKTNYSIPDTGQRSVIDSVTIDSVRQFKKWIWRDAKVVYNSVNSERNYLQLNRGAKYGIMDNMAVLNSDGAVVGQIVNVSNNFSEVMSLLHIQSSVSAALKKTGDAGKLEWDGKDPSFLTLHSIPKSAKVQKGDTILTSNVSEKLSFPAGLMVGRVEEIIADPSSNFLTLKVRSATNFYTLQYVYLSDNLEAAEQQQLESKTPKD